MKLFQEPEETDIVNRRFHKAIILVNCPIILLYLYLCGQHIYILQVSSCIGYTFVHVM